MSEIPGDLKFMKSHEWARVEGDGKNTVARRIARRRILKRNFKPTRR